MPECRECGKPFAQEQSRKGGAKKTVFCCARCGTDFNNRRKNRGALLYDIMMSKRYDRQHEKTALSLMDNICRAARDADKALRSGRASWRPYHEAKAAVPLAYGSEGDQR